MFAVYPASLTPRSQPKAINNAKICPGFNVVANPYQADKTDATKQAVDLGLYRTKHAPKRDKNKAYPAVDWFGIDLPMECKAWNIIGIVSQGVLETAFACCFVSFIPIYGR